MRCETWFVLAEFACRAGLCVLFVYSAWAKIEDPGLFADSVMRFELLPQFMVGFFSLSLPMVELLVGFMFVFTKWLREAAFVTTGMLVMFISALSLAVARGLEIDCGCFGFSSTGGRQELLIAIVRDIVLLVPSIWLMLRPNGWIAANLLARWRMGRSGVDGNQGGCESAR